MARSFASIEKVVLSKKDSNGTQNAHRLGLRYPAKLTISDNPITIDRNRPISNFVDFDFEAETLECDFYMLKDFIEVYCVDGMIDAYMMTAAQQPTADSRGMKGNEIYQFGWNPNGNGYLGFGFKYVESFSNGNKKTSATVKGKLSLENTEASTILLSALTNDLYLNDFGSQHKINPGNIVSISYADSELISKHEIHSYNLSIETKGDEPTVYGRECSDYLSVTCEIVTKNSGVNKFQEILSRATNSNLVIKEKLSPNLYFEKEFEAIGKAVSVEIGDKRFMKLTFKGDFPLINTSFTSNTSEGVMVRIMKLGDKI